MTRNCNFDKNELIDALYAIPPSDLDHNEWMTIAAALHISDIDFDIFDDWSSQDARPGQYSRAQCEKTWRSFDDDKPNNVTHLVIFKWARDRYNWRGWNNGKKHKAFGWDDKIVAENENADYLHHVEAADVGEEPIPRGKPEDAAKECINYLEALFAPDETVGYIVQASDVRLDDDGKWKPASKGVYIFTCAQLVESIKKHPEDLSMTFGTPQDGAGAWVRINPLDGQGVKDENITDFRYALIEADEMEPERQLAFIHQLRLPVAAISTSGGKSVHAIVHIDAADRNEYRERVKELYEHCKAHGFEIDEQNRNPSRLSRLPGFKRGEGEDGEWQRLVQIGPGDEGFSSWSEWRDWCSGFPQIENVAKLQSLPPLAPELIEGVLRDGQKLLLAADSKGGKSFALIQLAIACVLGLEWLGHQVERGDVLYINLEIERRSFLHRIVNVRRAQLAREGKSASDEEILKSLDGLDVWNLRGHGGPLTELEPTIVRMAARTKRHYRLIIVDPIYKVLTGDENSASDMSALCNEFDKIAEELGCAVAYAHHHTKGSQGEKAAQDRASGSGVFARDPDAQLDMSRLAVGENLFDLVTFDGIVEDAYRINYTLREFRRPVPTDVVFHWPLHIPVDGLEDCRIPGEKSTDAERTKNMVNKKQEMADGRWDERNALTEHVFSYAEGLPGGASMKNVEGMLEMLQKQDKDYAKRCKEADVTIENIKLWTMPSKQDGDCRRYAFQRADGKLEKRDLGNG